MIFYEMIRNIEFKSRSEVLKRNKFQQVINRDIKATNASSQLLVPADKTTNSYKVEKEDYKRLLRDNITQKYKKVECSVMSAINSEAKAIATKLNLEDRIEQMANKAAFATLKDHKENFTSASQCRLINPAKSEIGKVSKKILDEINCDIRTKLKLNQWRSIDSVTSWFMKLFNKDSCKLFKFDIVEFYPSISESLLNLCSQFAKSYTSISSDKIEIIRHCRKSVLFNDRSTWVKKENNAFDVTMGSYDEAEVCELVGLFLFHKLAQVIDKSLIVMTVSRF